MSEKEDIAAAKRLYNEVFTGGDTSILDTIALNNLTLHDPTAKGFKGGLQAFKEREAMYSRAFPDKKATIDELISTEDKVIVRWTVKGTHKNELPGIPSTQKSINVTGISILKFKNGKIVEIWANWDYLGLLSQLGIQVPKALAGVR